MHNGRKKNQIADRDALGELQPYKLYTLQYYIHMYAFVWFKRDRRHIICKPEVTQKTSLNTGKVNVIVWERILFAP